MYSQGLKGDIMSKWVYGVASERLEDCFVVAKNSMSAKRIEKEKNGF